MKYQAKLTIMHYAGGGQNGFFKTVEEGMAVLDEFSKALAKIKEYGNRDEDPVFRFSAAGAFYAVDLRKVQGAVLEVSAEWADVTRERHMHFLGEHRATKAMAAERGLDIEFSQLTEMTPQPVLPPAPPPRASQ